MFALHLACPIEILYLFYAALYRYRAGTGCGAFGCIFLRSGTTCEIAFLLKPRYFSRNVRAVTP